MIYPFGSCNKSAVDYSIWRQRYGGQTRAGSGSPWHLAQSASSFSRIVRMTLTDEGLSFCEAKLGERILGPYCYQLGGSWTSICGGDFHDHLVCSVGADVLISASFLVSSRYSARLAFGGLL